jgi:hypothetical protein
VTQVNTATESVQVHSSESIQEAQDMFDLFVTGDLVRKQVGRQFAPETARDRGGAATTRNRRRRRPAVAARVFASLRGASARALVD